MIHQIIANSKYTRKRQFNLSTMNITMTNMKPIYMRINRESDYILVATESELLCVRYSWEKD